MLLFNFALDFAIYFVNLGELKVKNAFIEPVQPVDQEYLASRKEKLYFQLGLTYFMSYGEVGIFQNNRVE